MLGHEARGTAIEKTYAVRSWQLEQGKARRIRRKARAGAAGGAYAAHGRRVRRAPVARAGFVVMAFAMLMGVLVG